MGLDDIRRRIAAAEAAAGRPAGSVTLIAVSKLQPPDRVEAVLEAGARVFGENYVQEAQGKWPVWRERWPDVALHLIGPLQSNKARAAIELFDAIHSLDRESLRDALSALDAPPPCFVQVNIGAEPQKGGVDIDALAPFLETVRASAIRLAGLMCIPPADVQPGPYFALLADLARRHDVGELSMGMSDDYPTAVMLGATHVRVGSALFE